MNVYDEARLHSKNLAATMPQPPFPVVQQYGFYAFLVDGRYPAAVTVPGVGQVYASDFRTWAGQEFDQEFVEPSAEMLVAMLKAEEKIRSSR